MPSGPSTTGAHVALGARRSVSDHSDLGARVDFDDLGGKSLIGLYLGTSTIVSSYGAAGALASVLLWIYYSAQIFLLGACFTKACAVSARRHRGPTERTAAVH